MSIFDQNVTLDPYHNDVNEDLVLPIHLPDVSRSWYLLVYPIMPKKATSGGIILTQQTHDALATLTTVGVVVEKGALAYNHPRFHNPITNEYEHWVQEGDFVLFKRHLAGAEQLDFEGKKFYIIPDSGVICKMDHPCRFDKLYSYSEEEIEKMRQSINEHKTRKAVK